MAIDRQHGKVIFICDECDDSYESEEKDFLAALSLAKEEGWLIKRNDKDTEWQHICNECVSGRQ